MFLFAGPNPFRAGTHITFSVPETDLATLDVFDVQGRRLARLFEERARGGKTYRIRFDAAGRAAGIYFAKLSYRGRDRHTKLLLVQ